MTPSEDIKRRVNKFAGRDAPAHADHYIAAILEYLDAHAGGATVSERENARMGPCPKCDDTGKERASGDRDDIYAGWKCCDCTAGKKLARSISPAISKSETTQPATGDGTGEDEVARHDRIVEMARKLQEAEDLLSIIRAALEIGPGDELTQINYVKEHLGILAGERAALEIERDDLKEKLAAAETEKTELERRCLAFMTAHHEAERRVEKAEARVSAWSEIVRRAIEWSEKKIEAQGKGEGVTWNVFESLLAGGIAALPDEYRPEVKP